MISRRRLGWMAMGAASAGFRPAWARNTNPRLYPPAQKADQQMVRAGSLATKVRILGAGGVEQLRSGGLVTDEVWRRMQFADLGADGTETVWRLFFRSAQTFFGHIESTTPVIGFYNPFLDAWWLTQWSIPGQNDRINDAKFIAGTALSGPASDGPAWMTTLTRRTPIEAVRQALADAGHHFSENFAFQGGSGQGVYRQIREAADAQQAFLTRILTISRGISEFSRDTGVAPTYRLMLQRLAMAAPSAQGLDLTPEATDTFATGAKVPAILRTGLLPVGAVKIGEHWFAFSASALAGRFAAISVLKPTPKGGQLERFALFDLTGRS